VPLSIVVLAAGQGKRMRSALPKVLQPLAGKPLLAHVLAAARQLEPAALYVVYGHGGEAVRQRFGAETDLSWCLQEEQLGTGHAVAQALPAIPDEHRVLILCGDVPLILPESLRPLCAAESSEELALLTALVPNPDGYGRVLRDAHAAVTGVVEHKDATPDQLASSEINSGIMAVGAKRLRGWLAQLGNDNAQGEYYLPDVIAMAVADGVRVRGTRADSAEEILGINDKRQLATAERSMQRRAADSLLLRGATLADPARVEVRGDVQIGRDVFIDVGVVMEGNVQLGDGVRVGPYTLLSDCSIGHDSVVESHSVLEQSDVGRRCRIGPYARLRPGSSLADEAKIGNFVEVKNSSIGAGSKVNHLSYVGDASIGRHVNVGAGTITCNYDGAAKHRTTIGDDVFVGSGVMLVAPITVGDGATIGAGSTLSKDAPAGRLSLARSRQITIEGWQRPVKRSG
jgi:bifunctional UDP-N-acetylglucosamine pyrophosphorylase/glucosamine-1-phosphate N-acetyltransferase